jgi:Flp pilus assembly protein CpaB
VAVISTSPTRALRRPLRLDVRALVGVLLMLVAIGGSIAVWTSEQDTRGVLVVARDLPAGTTLTADDLTVSRARLDDAVYQAAVPAASLNRVVGQQLAGPAHANQVLAQAQLSSRPSVGPNQLVIAIPVTPANSAGGRIRAGDAVQVLSTNTRGDLSTRVLIPRAIVYDAGSEDETTSSSSSARSGTSLDVAGAAPAWITLIVDQQQAVQLTQARRSGELDVALLPPATP